MTLQRWNCTAVEVSSDSRMPYTTSFNMAFTLLLRGNLVREIGLVYSSMTGLPSTWAGDDLAFSRMGGITRSMNDGLASCYHNRGAVRRFCVAESSGVSPSSCSERTAWGRLRLALRLMCGGMDMRYL